MACMTRQLILTLSAGPSCCWKYLISHLLVVEAILVKVHQGLEEVGVGHHGLGACPAHILEVAQDDHTFTDLRAS